MEINLARSPLVFHVTKSDNIIRVKSILRNTRFDMTKRIGYSNDEDAAKDNFTSAFDVRKSTDERNTCQYSEKMLES